MWATPNVAASFSLTYYKQIKCKPYAFVGGETVQTNTNICFEELSESLFLATVKFLLMVINIRTTCLEVCTIVSSHAQFRSLVTVIGHKLPIRMLKNSGPPYACHWDNVWFRKLTFMKRTCGRMQVETDCLCLSNYC